MTKREMLKPFSWGIVSGCVALTIVAFSAGWVVTSSARDHQVKAALIGGQASICAKLAQDHRQATGDVTDLLGYQASDARETLAKTFAVALPGQETADAGVIRACSDMLNKAALAN